jgi:hypothetical protein
MGLTDRVRDWLARGKTSCVMCGVLQDKLPGNLCDECFQRVVRPPATNTYADFELGTAWGMTKHGDN